MGSGLVIGHVRGIEIRVNWSVLVIAGLVGWTLADGVLPELAPGYRTAEYWLVGVGLSIALLAGLAAHELGHSLVAAREGVAVESVTLWMFGGVAKLVSNPPTPKAALRIATAGPAVSLGLGSLAIIVSLPLSGLAAAGVVWYGVINIALGVFNLLPAYPTDGGRIYQAWLWSRSGDELSATRRAAGTGQFLGGVLMALGFLQALFADAIGGIWLVLVGGFIRAAAQAELDRAVITGPLRSIGVIDVMTADPERVRAESSLAAFVSEMVLGGRHTTYPVIREDGSVAGLIALSSVRDVDRAEWPTTTVGEAATPIDEVLTVSSSTNVADLLERMQGDSRRRALVMDHGRLVGIVAPADLARLIAALELAGPEALVE